MSNIIDLRTQKMIKRIETNKSAMTNKEIENLTQKTELRKSPKKQNKNEILKPETIEWEAMEFTLYEKDPLWFFIGGVLTIILLLIAIFSKNFIFVFVILLSAFSIYVWSQKVPRKIEFAITPKGIKIEDNVYSYENLKSFWIFYDPPEIKYLSILSKKLFMPKITIPLGEENPNKIRDVLLKYLPEEEQQESLIDVLARYLRY